MFSAEYSAESGHVLDGFVCHLVVPDFLDGQEKGLVVRFVARQSFHGEWNSVLVRNQGNDELFEV